MKCYVKLCKWWIIKLDQCFLKFKPRKETFNLEPIEENLNFGHQAFFKKFVVFAACFKEGYDLDDIETSINPSHETYPIFI